MGPVRRLSVLFVGVQASGLFTVSRVAIGLTLFSRNSTQRLEDICT